MFKKNHYLATFATIFICIFSFLLIADSANAQFVDKKQSVAVYQEKNSFDNAVKITNILFALAFILSIFGFLTSIVTFVISGGSEKLLANAHKAWIASLIGLCISLVGFVVSNVIKYYFR